MFPVCVKGYLWGIVELALKSEHISEIDCHRLMVKRFTLTVLIKYDFRMDWWALARAEDELANRDLKAAVLVVGALVSHQNQKEDVVQWWSHGPSMLTEQILITFW